MSGKMHNKKRNAGLLYEFLVRSISSALIDGDQKKSAMALKLIKRYFKPGTELHKEFRLINSLVKTTVSSEAVASNILTEARKAAKLYDEEKLDREKSLLIRNINHTLNDQNFFDRHVNEYKLYATIQSLIKDWRSNSPDISRMAVYEDQLVSHLLTQKEERPGVVIEHSDNDSKLLMKMMLKKINDKYSSALTENEKDIVRSYVQASSGSDSTVFTQKLQELKKQVLSSIDENLNDKSIGDITSKKLLEVREIIANDNADSISDESVANYMLYAKLNDELNSRDGEE